MFVKIKTKLKNMEGVELKMKLPVNQSGVEEKEKYITLKRICVNALLSEAKEEKNIIITGEEKVKRYELAKKIQEAETKVDLKTEEIVLIKKMIGLVYPPLIVGQCFQLLENNEKENEDN